MSISDRIVVMQEGLLMQEGAPQQVYDDPASLFVAKFLGTPPINVFEGSVRDQTLCLEGVPVLRTPGVTDQKVWVGVRPEGFVPDPQGSVVCAMDRVEVLGRDVSIVCAHPACQAPKIRAIVDASSRVDGGEQTVRFSLRPHKVFLFHHESQLRLPVAGEAGPL